MAAVKKLTNQASLTEIANKKDEHDDIRMAAAERLTDQALAQVVYDDISKNSKYPKVRMAAAKNLTDQAVAQAVYAEIAKKDKDSEMRMAAAERLTDQALAQVVYAEIAKNDRDSDVREAAAGKVTDWALQVKLQNDLEHMTRAAAKELKQRQCEHRHYDSWKTGDCSFCGSAKIQFRCRDCGLEWPAHTCT
jgi:uncharacterized DUF497 family protein